MLSLDNFKSLKPMLAVAVLSATLGMTACSTSVDPDVQARQDIMKNYGDAMGIMGSMLKEPNTFDAAILQDQTSYLAEASKEPWVHFGDPEAVGNATAAVWTDNETFIARSEEFQQASAQLNTVAQTATSTSDYQAAFSDVGASCKSCHTDFQVKTDN
jgi:cytochrome c556